MNYGYWKARMGAFMKSLDNKTWKTVIHGWAAPITIYDKGIETGLKPEKDWSPAEDESTLGTMGSLMAFELSLPKLEKKNKGMAFKSSILD